MKINKIIRSKRKSIALQICEDATIVVKAPLEVKDDIIMQFILKHQKWLKKKQKEIFARNINFTKKQFVDGEKFFYLGTPYSLKIVDNNQTSCPLRLGNSCFYLQKGINDRKEAFLKWYQREAYEKIRNRVNYYAEKTGLQYNKVKISNARRQWGSCTRLNNLYFSWRIIMGPYSVIDYVVVHELVHIIEKNHSKNFWDKVRSIMPDYKIQRNWLKKNGYLLTI